MRHARILLGIVAVLAIVPATAQAGPFWEVKGPPSAWSALPSSTPLTILSNPTLAITDGSTFKSTCQGGDTEIAENPASGAPGQDEMVEFQIVCKVNGNAPYPCTAGEAYEFKGALTAGLPAWPSEHTGNVYDVFEKVQLEIVCLTSAATAIYHPPGGAWVAKLTANKLKFASPGIFKDGVHSFMLYGNDALKPLGRAKVR